MDDESLPVPADRKNSKSEGPIATFDADGNILEEDPMADFIAKLAEEKAEELRFLNARSFVDRPLFIGIVMTAICINAVQMGLELQLTGGNWKLIWRLFENFWTAFFLGEMVVKWWFIRLRYFLSKTNIMDFVIVLAAIADTWVLANILDEDQKDGLGWLQVVKLIRLARILKILRIKPQLAVTLDGISSSVSSMTWLGVLLAIMIYTAAICFVQFIGKSKGVYPKEEFDPEHFYGDLVKACQTNLNLAFLEEWPTVVRPIMKYQPWFAVMIMFYVGCASFGIINALIGIIVTKTSAATVAAAEAAHARFQQQQMGFVANISSIIYAIDADGDGTVSHTEIEAAKNNPELISTLEKVDLPFAFTLSDLHTMMDRNGDGELTKTEYFVSMTRLIFSNEFQRQCILHYNMSLQKQQMFQLRLGIDEHFNSVHERFLKAEADIDEKVCNRIERFDEKMSTQLDTMQAQILSVAEAVKSPMYLEALEAAKIKTEEELAAIEAARLAEEEAAKKVNVEQVDELVVTRMVESTLMCNIMKLDELVNNLTYGLTCPIAEVTLQLDQKVNELLTRPQFHEPDPANQAAVEKKISDTAVLIGEVAKAKDISELFGKLTTDMGTLRKQTQEDIGAIKKQVTDSMAGLNKQLGSEAAWVREKLEARQSQQCSAVALPNPAPQGPYTLAMTEASITIQSAHPPIVTAGPILLPPAPGLLGGSDMNRNSVQASFDNPVMLPGSLNSPFSSSNNLATEQPSIGNKGFSNPGSAGQYRNGMSPQQGRPNTGQSRSNIPGQVGSPNNASMSNLRQGGQGWS